MAYRKRKPIKRNILLSFNRNKSKPMFAFIKALNQIGHLIKCFVVVFFILLFFFRSQQRPTVQIDLTFLIAAGAACVALVVIIIIVVVIIARRNKQRRSFPINDVRILSRPESPEVKKVTMQDLEKQVLDLDKQFL